MMPERYTCCHCRRHHSGGVAYIRCLDALADLKGDNDDEQTGIAIVERLSRTPRARLQPMRVEGAVVVLKVREGTGDFVILPVPTATRTSHGSRCDRLR